MTLIFLRAVSTSSPTLPICSKRLCLSVPFALVTFTGKMKTKRVRRRGTERREGRGKIERKGKETERYVLRREKGKNRDLERGDCEMQLSEPSALIIFPRHLGTLSKYEMIHT
jgi:hypothetical protein